MVSMRSRAHQSPCTRASGEPTRLVALVAGLALAVLLSLAVAGTALGASAAAVRECVERNAVRYSDPSSSAVGQYFDIQAACQAALDEENDHGFTVTPDQTSSDGRGEAAASDSGESSGGSSSSPQTGTPTQTTQDGSGSGSGTDSGSQTTSPESASESSSPKPADEADQEDAATPAATTTPTVSAAELPDEAVEGGVLSGTPIWLLAIVAAGILASGGYAVWEARASRRR